MTRNTTSRKSTTPRRKAGETPTPPGAASGPAPGPVLRKKDLIERVVTQSGLKKKDVRPVVEATLAVLGEALSQQERLNLPPFGKLTVNRRKALANGEVLNARVRRSPHSVEEVRKDPLAEPEE
ncbi:HU family DNA-binding protein [Actibacterium sp. MT2.3-13A]|uniref:HU family DNA-binding protein n=1 Tax=Actibacterium sp. MT2.3-13A TaxID=2828332 RepID=UPI001BAD9750|nr:HU family DNA-binding protein [Actibacterium sp. MT2.3-13A]